MAEKRTIIEVLADWESEHGSLAAIMPNEWAALMEAVTQAAIYQSPRQALSAPPPAGAQQAVALTDDEIDRLQEEYDCFGRADAPRIHDFARGVEKAVRNALASPAAASEAAAPMFYASLEQANALQDRPGDNEGGVYLPVRKTPAGKFAMPLYAAPAAAQGAVTGSELLSVIHALMRDTKDYGQPELIAKNWAEEVMRKCALSATPAPEAAPSAKEGDALTDKQMFEIVRGTGYVTRGQAHEIVELLRGAIKGLTPAGGDR